MCKFQIKIGKVFNPILHNKPLMTQAFRELELENRKCVSFSPLKPPHAPVIQKRFKFTSHTIQQR
jgi:hypothetical protein